MVILPPDPATLLPAEDLLAPGRDTSLAFHRQAADRMAPKCVPAIRPRFTIDARRPIFVIGSCFAREIAARLRDMGASVPEFDFRMTTDEWPALTAVIVNKFTPATIFNEIKWCHDILVRGDGFRPEDADALLYDLGDGTVVDGSLMGLRPVSRARAIQRRAALFDYFAQAFRADTLVMTLGLVEGWWDSERGRYIEEFPGNPQLLQRYPGRFHFHKMEFGQCLAYLEESLQLLAAIGGPKKLLITTSPVPMARTFSDDDVIVANSHGKSLLRAVCGTLRDRNPDVDYFPSYESVMLTRTWDVFARDRRHVARPEVARVVAQVIESYFTNVPDAHKALTASVLAFHDGAFDRALALAEQVVETLKGSLEAWYQLAQCRDKVGDYAGAADALEQVCRCSHDPAMGLFLLADGHVKAGQPDRVLDRLQDFLVAHPETPAVGLALAKTLHALGRDKDCLDIINSLDGRTHLPDDILLIASDLHEARGDLAAALSAARRAEVVSWQSGTAVARVAALEARAAAT